MLVFSAQEAANRWTAEGVTGIINLIGIVYVGIQQFIHKKSTKRAAKKAEEAASVAKHAAESAAQEVKTEVIRVQGVNKSEFDSIKALLNGDKLAMLEQKTDALLVVADYRNLPGDREAYQKSCDELKQLRINQAVFLAKAIQSKQDAAELEEFRKKKAKNIS